MKEYRSPMAELITFKNENIMTAVSGCDCFFNIAKHEMGFGGDVECMAISGHAKENPFGIDAPSWNF